jgi:chromosome segregation ATPase
MKLSELVTEGADLLGSLRGKLAELEDIEGQTAAARAALGEIREQHAAVLVGIDQDKDAAVRDLKKAKTDLDSLRNEQAFELVRHQKAVGTMREELKKLEGELAAKQALHNQIGASIESLRKRFVG